jgi:hypothetical protein
MVIGIVADVHESEGTRQRRAWNLSEGSGARDQASVRGMNVQA